MHLLPAITCVIFLSSLSSRVSAERVWIISLIPDKDPLHATSVPNAVNDFSIALLDEVARQDKGHNIFVSPFSISTSLSMILLGARRQTAQELSSGLRFNQTDLRNGKNIHQLFNEFYNDKIRKLRSIRLSNYLLIQEGETDREIAVLEKYKDDMRLLYEGSRVETVNFTTDADVIKDSVNDWISNQTYGRVPMIMGSAPEAFSRILALNAVNFMGRWAQAFDPSNTVRMRFYTRIWTQIEADFMVMPRGQFRYKKMRMSGLDVQVLDMPYAEDNLSMLILLPSKTLGFIRLMKSDNFASQLETLLQSIGAQLQRRQVKVMMPKFRLETNHSLIPVLSEMGIRKIFAAGYAELEGINGNSNLLVTQMTHKAMIDVNEGGTEANVASGNIESRDTLDEVVPIEFRIDHPFMFFIRDRITGLIYAAGKVETV